MKAHNWNNRIFSRGLLKVWEKGGFEKDEVSADGSCFFHSILSLSKREGQREEVPYFLLRSNLVDHMHTNYREEFAPFFDNNDECFDLYCNEMKDNESYVGNYDVVAMADFIGRKIFVIDSSMDVQFNNGELVVPDHLQFSPRHYVGNKHIQPFYLHYDSFIKHYSLMAKNRNKRTAAEACLDGSESKKLD